MMPSIAASAVPARRLAKPLPSRGRLTSSGQDLGRCQSTCMQAFPRAWRRRPAHIADCADRSSRAGFGSPGFLPAMIEQTSVAGPATAPPLWLLVLITASGTLGMHIFIPALSEVGRD